jgi:hypothetical protein
LSTRDPAEQPRFVDVPLAGDVRASIDERMESSFDVAARVQAGALLLRWTHIERPVTGVPGSDRTTTGAVRIDLPTGRVDPIDEMPAPPEPEPPAAIARLVEAREIGPLRHVGAVWVAIDRTTQAGKQRVRLVRWNAGTGEALPDVTLFEDGTGFRSLSADERHLLASRRDPSDGRTWQWRVYSLETGARLAELRNEEPGARFLVAGSRLLHETNPTSRSVGSQVRVEPGRLRAVELEAGTEVWSHEIRDTRYRGSYPPREGPVE